MGARWEAQTDGASSGLFAIVGARPHPGSPYGLSWRWASPVEARFAASRNWTAGGAMRAGDKADFFLSRRGSVAAVARKVEHVLAERGYRVIVRDYDIPLTTNFIEAMDA